MHGFGLDAGDGTWFIINPAHIQIARNQLTMSDLRHLQLADADARALFDIAKPYFDEVGQAALVIAFLHRAGGNAQPQGAAARRRRILVQDIAHAVGQSPVARRRIRLDIAVVLGPGHTLADRTPGHNRLGRYRSCNRQRADQHNGDKA